MRILLDARIAARSAIDNRFKTAALVLVGGLVTVAVLVALSTSAVRTVEQERSANMTGLLSDRASSSDLLVLSTTKRIADHRIDVHFIETLGQDSIRPVGVDQLPPVGSAVVSPALREAVRTDGALATRFVVDDVIDPDGVVSGGQLLAYVRVPEGTLSQDGKDILRAVDGEYAGIGPVDRIKSFGSPGATDLAIQGTGLSDTWIEPTHVQAIWVLTLCSALVLLWVGLGISSQTSARRLALLQFLGVPRRERVLIATIEALLPILIGVALVCLTWSGLGEQPWIFAVAGYSVFSGDAALSVDARLVAGAAVGAATSALSVTMALLARGPSGSRPAQERMSPKRWASVPAGLAAGLLALAVITPSDFAGQIALAGSVLAAISIPLLVPGLMRSVGDTVARTREPATFLTGRFMGFDPVGSARPFAGLATLLVLAGSSAGWVAVANYVEATPGASSGTQVTLASWRSTPSRHLTAQLREQLPGLAVAEFSIDGDTALLETTCAAVASSASDVACEHGALVGSGADELKSRLQMVLDDAPLLRALTFVPPDGRSDGSASRQLLVIGRGDGVVQDARVEAALGQLVDVPQVEGMSNSLGSPSALVPWISFGLLLASTLLGVGCLLLVSDRFRHVLAQHRALHLMGLTSQQMRHVASLLFMLPYAVISSVGLALGVIACLAISGRTGPPWPTLGLLLGVTLVGGVIVGLTLPQRARLPHVE